MKLKMLPSFARRSVGSVRRSAAIELLETRRLLSGELFVTDITAGTVAEYDSSGNLINAQLISGLSSPDGIAISGNDLFVVNAGTASVGEYTTSGATVNASLITGLTDPQDILVAGAAIFISGEFGVSEYSITGATANPSLRSDLQQASNLGISGSDLYVDVGAPYVYDLSNLSGGSPTYLFNLPAGNGIAIQGSNVFAGSGNGIAEYSTSGTTENASLASTYFNPDAMAVSGSNLFVLEDGSSSQQGFNYQRFNLVEEFDTSGNLINGSFGPSTNDVLGGIAAEGSETEALNQLVFTAQPSNSGSTLSAVQVDIEDASGNIVTSDNSNVTLTLNNPNVVPGATLNGTVTVAAVNGVATFNGVSVSAAGTGYTLAAADGDNVPSTSSAFAVTTGSGGGGGGGGGGGTVTGSAHAILAQQPSSAAAGAKMSSIEVTLESASGTAATTSKSKVTLSILSGPSGGKIIGSATQSPKAGNATFKNLKLEKAGTYTLEASASGFAPADSSTITITGGAVKKAIFNPEPANVTAGTPFNVAVELTDAYGNEAGDGDTVTLALQTHAKGSTLAGDLTATSSDGVADFDDLTLATAGDYSLKATAGKAKATSAKFVVS